MTMIDFKWGHFPLASLLIKFSAFVGLKYYIIEENQRTSIVIQIMDSHNHIVLHR